MGGVFLADRGTSHTLRQMRMAKAEFLQGHFLGDELYRAVRVDGEGPVFLCLGLDGALQAR